MVPVDVQLSFPCLMVTIENEVETIGPGGGAGGGGGTNVRDDYGFPIRVWICDQMDMTNLAQQKAKRLKYSKWREQIERAFSRQRLTGVPEIFDCVVTAATMFPADLPLRNYVMSELTLRFFDRLTRGTTS